MLRFLVFAFGIGCMLPMAATPVHAHPHAWIYYEIEVVFDQQARVTGLRQTWQFDEYYTVYATAGLPGGEGQPDQQVLDELTAANLESLREYGYFTEVRHAREAVQLRPASEMATRMDGDNMEMTFLAELEQAVDPRKAEFSYRVFDPSYYIEMVHMPSPTAIRLSNAPASCKADLILPDPNPEMSALAAALDRTQSSIDGLGALFAEKVVITCDPPS